MTEPQTQPWAPDSWRTFPAAHQPVYDDPQALERALVKLRRLPPLVTSGEVERLRGLIAEAAEGRAFLLQGGECAESFDECSSDHIAAHLKVLLRMSMVLIQGLKRPIVRVGRYAGQYAKPRSSPTETRDGETLPSYFGDLVNASEFDADSRRPNPARLLRGHGNAAVTLNFIRSLLAGGFADLHHPEYWTLGFLGRASLPEDLRADYMRIRDSLRNAIEVMEVIAGRRIAELSTVEFFSSHEGLVLEFERALAREVPRRDGWYDLSCHLPWIGERTRQLDGAHIEFFRGLRNPVGVKIGPTATPEEVLRLADRLDPENEPGRLVLIGRFGATQIGERLPPLVRALRNAGRRPAWLCDPMHGNTTTTSAGIKTRRFENILHEIETAIAIHEEESVPLAGVHFELVGEDVTECVGGASGVTEDDLRTSYQTLCDPRLNDEQAMELAFAIANRLGR